MSRSRVTRRSFLATSSTALLLAGLPGCDWFGGGTVGHFLRRKNLSTDFSRAEQRELADLVYGYLTEDIIRGHMHQVDHIDNLFSDHRTYLFRVERQLIRDGLTKYVPLPIWEPLDNLPDGWDRVHPPYQFLRLTPFNLIPREARPRIDDELRPERIAEFPDAAAVADKFGRSAFSDPDSYHFRSHAVLGGPFVSMTTAGSGLIFWAFHGLLVDVYDLWLSHRFPAPSRRTTLGRHGDGRLDVLAVSSLGHLWHAAQRRTTTHRNEANDVLGEVPVEFPHWTHWFDVTRGPAGGDLEIEDVRTVTGADGNLVVVARGTSAAGSPRLLVKRGIEAQTEWTDLGAESAGVVDYGLVVNPDGSVEIVAILEGSAGRVVATRMESAPGTGAFGPWSEIAAADGYLALTPGRYVDSSGELRPQLVVTASQAGTAPGPPARLIHMWKDSSSWRRAPRAEEGYVSAQLLGRADGRVQIAAVRASDGAVLTAGTLPGTPIDSDASWTPWQRVGAASSTFREVAIAPHADGRVEIFGIDTAGAARHAGERDSGWSDWSAIPAVAPMTVVSAPLAELDFTGRIQLFVQGDSNFTFVAEQTAPNAPSWLGWTNI